MDEKPFVESYIIDDDILVIRLHGKLNQTTAPEFEAEIDKQIKDGITKVIIDCAHLGYVSSYGVGALVMLQTRLRKRGGEVKLAAIQTIVSDIFRIVRLERMLDIYGDIEFARESFYEK